MSEANIQAGVNKSSASRSGRNRPIEVKNKQPADVQVTAEQIVREARERQEDDYKAPTARLTDPEEIAEYRMEKRKFFEDSIRRQRWKLDEWIKYAKWEEQQQDYKRARSIWERALDQNPHHVPFWTKYAEMEMRVKNVNHARNVWDRAVSILPRIDQLWYQYVHMEQMLGNIPRARQVFERWMHWEPDQQAWHAYINMEIRCGEIDRARSIYERYVQVHPTVDAWKKYAKFEYQYGSKQQARQVYERAVQELEDDPEVEDLYVAFAEFEEKAKEPERARAIYQYALDNLPKDKAEEVYKKYSAFERKHGNKEGIDDVVTSKKRLEYEEACRANPMNYDNWFDYARLEESTGDIERVREVYERAVANTPPAEEKRYWQRYIYLWIFYALFEELDVDDVDRARQVYKQALDIVPHSKFTFAKLWVLAAKLEIRQKRLNAARKVYGLAIAKAPKDKVFKSYIEMEQQLGNIDRCRKIYDKYLEWAPHNCNAWVQFAEMERLLGETERARAIYELAVKQPALDMPEALWRAYIDFEAAEGNRENAKALYERLLGRTNHVKAWLAYANFLAKPLPLPDDISPEEEERIREERSKWPSEQPSSRVEAAREVYERAERSLRELSPEEKEARVMLLEAWLQFEQERGSEDKRREVEEKMPQRVKRKRAAQSTDGAPEEEEEYYDYVFPEEQSASSSLRLLQAAYQWKRQKTQHYSHQSDGSPSPERGHSPE